MSTMKAYAVLENHTSGFIESPKPVCGPQDVICRPIALAPCTSDIHMIESEFFGKPPGFHLGHEAVGQIVEAGNLVTEFKVGDKIIVPANRVQWGEVLAQEGMPMHTDLSLFNPKKKYNFYGAIAEFFWVPDADFNVTLLPEGMDPAVAVMITDMMPTGFHGADLAEINFGDTVCVIGLGPVGLMALRASALKGAGRIIGIDGVRPKCNKLALEYGATDIVDFREGPIHEQVLKLTGGKCVDKVIIAGGDVNIIETAIKIVRIGGIIANINYFTDGVQIPIPTLYWGFGLSHKTIKGGMCPGGRALMERMLELIKYKRCDPSGLVTHRFESLDKIDEAFHLMRSKSLDVIKPVILLKYD